MSDESKRRRRRALRDASDRLRAGDQNLFTRPYSDQIPLDDELKGDFDIRVNEMGPEDEDHGVLRANFIDDVLLLEGKRQAAYHLIALGTFAAVMYVIAAIYTKAREIVQPYGIHDPSYGFFYVLRKLAEGSGGLFIMTALIAALIAAEFAQRYKNRARRIKGDTDERHRDAHTSSGWLNDDTETLINTFDIVYPQYGDDVPWLQRAASRLYAAGVRGENASACRYEPTGIPLCLLGENLLCMPDEPKHYQFKNKNICICGISGGGKSFGAIKPMVMTILSKSDRKSVV